MTVDIDKHKNGNCSIKVLPLFLIAFLCLVVISIKEVDGIGYSLLLSFIILGGFVVFTKSIEDRYLWLIVFIPLSTYQKKTFGIYISPYDIASILFLTEAFLTYKLFFLQKRRENIVVLLLILVIIVSSLLSPISNIQPGLIIRAGINLFIFLFGIKLFHNYQQFRYILVALMLLLPMYVFSDLVVIIGGFGTVTRRQDLVNMGYYVKEMEIQNFRQYLLYAKSRNVINFALISIPCFFIYRFAQSKIIVASALFLIFIVTAMILSQTLYLILLVNLLILGWLFIGKARGLLKPITLFAIILFTVIAAKPVMNYLTEKVTYESAEGYINDGGDGGITHDEGNSMRMLTILSNLQAFIKHPILGLGIGNSTRRGDIIAIDEMISPEEEMETGENAMNAHNTFLRIAPELGLMGLILVFILLYRSAKSLYGQKAHLENHNTVIEPNIKTINLILTLIFINTLIYMMTHDIFMSPRLWVVLMTLIVWSNVKNITSDKTPNCEKYLVES